MAIIHEEHVLHDTVQISGEFTVVLLLTATGDDWTPFHVDRHSYEQHPSHLRRKYFAEDYAFEDFLHLVRQHIYGIAPWGGSTP
jgi:hypothetical protein